MLKTPHIESDSAASSFGFELLIVLFLLISFNLLSILLSTEGSSSGVIGLIGLIDLTCLKKFNCL